MIRIKIAILNEGIIARTIDAVEKITREISRNIHPVKPYYEILNNKIEKNPILESWDPRREQCHMIKMLEHMNFGDVRMIVVTSKDLFADGLNWCFGGYVDDAMAIVLSTNRLTSQLHMEDLVAHEIGHMFFCVDYGRVNSYEELGPHCSNDLCVMQQKMTVAESVEYTKHRHKLNAPFYCPDCTDHMKKYFDKICTKTEAIETKQ